MIPFCKFHGFGNDYIVIEHDTIGDATPLDRLAIEICHRHTGVGSDGIAVLVRTGSGFGRELSRTGSDRVPESENEKDGIINADADYSCEIVNPDGSIAGFSGNGTRCAVAYLHYKGLWTETDLRLQTRSGIKNYHLIKKDGGEFWFEAEIGKPRFASEEIPVLTETRRDHVINEPIEVDGRHYTFSAVNVGNPVACIFVENFNFDWRSVGRTMETHEKFPERANIVFVKPTDRDNIDIRIWERGAGETAASGTCSSAAAVLSAFMKKTGRHVHVHSPGGMTDVVWRDDDEIVISGNARLAFCGEWPH